MSRPLWTGAEIATATRGALSAPFKADGVTFDSREVVGGELFVAMRGEVADGLEHPQGIAGDRVTIRIADEFQPDVFESVQGIYDSTAAYVVGDGVHREVSSRKVFFDGTIEDGDVKNGLSRGNTVCLDRFFPEEERSSSEEVFDQSKITGV